MIHKGESVENYLETILRMSKELTSVRSIDVVRETCFSKPSVSVAMKNMRQKELVVVDADGHITLTEEGRSIAESILERHTIISKILIALGVPAEIAAEDACKMEHVISEETFEALKSHLKEHGPR